MSDLRQRLVAEYGRHTFSPRGVCTCGAPVLDNERRIREAINHG